MRQKITATLERMILFLFFCAGAAPQPSPTSTPATQPARYSIHLTQVTAGQAVKTLVQQEHLPLQWFYRALNRRFDLQMENATAPEIVAELSQLGWCVPKSDFFSHGLIIVTPGRRPPLLRQDLDDGSILLVISAAIRSRMGFNSGAAGAVHKSFDLECVWLNNPAAAPVAVQYGIDVQGAVLADGQHVQMRSRYGTSNMQSLALGGFRAWPLRLNINLPPTLGPIATIEGQFKELIPLTWADCRLDNLAAGKTATANGITVSVDKMGEEDPLLSLYLSGPNINKKVQDLTSLCNNDGLRLMDAGGSAIPIRCDIAKKGDRWLVQVHDDRRKNEGASKPVSLRVKMPLTTHEKTVPVTLDVGKLMP